MSGVFLEYEVFYRVEFTVDNNDYTPCMSNYTVACKNILLPQPCKYVWFMHNNIKY